MPPQTGKRAPSTGWTRCRPSTAWSQRESGSISPQKTDFPATWWVINVLPDGRAELVLGEGTGEGKSVRPTCKTPLPAGAWAPLAFTVDRKHRQVTCCLNGVADATTPLPPPLTGALGAPGKDLRIPSSYKPFTGLFDEFRIYTRVLSEAEVKARYGTEKRGREGTGKE